MKQQFMLFTLFVVATVSGGCEAAKMAVSEEFWVYGMCDDATLVLRNDVPKSVNITIGGDRKLYTVLPDATLTIPGRYPVFSRVSRRIPVTASVTPFDPSVRSGMMTWNFSNQGHALNGYGGYTQGKEVHAIIELQNPDPKAKGNRLVFRVQQ